MLGAHGAAWKAAWGHDKAGRCERRLVGGEGGLGTGGKDGGDGEEAAAAESARVRVSSCPGALPGVGGPGL